MLLNNLVLNINIFNIGYTFIAVRAWVRWVEKKRIADMASKFTCSLSATGVREYLKLNTLSFYPCCFC